MADTAHYVKSTGKSSTTRDKGNLSLQFVNRPAVEGAQGRETEMKPCCLDRGGNRFGLSPLQIFIDIAIFSIVAIPVALYFFVLPPHHVGFFCNDDSIRYPYHQDTISTTLLLVVGVIVPITLMFAIELFNRRRKRLVFGHPTRILDAFKGIAAFLFGALVNEIFVEMAKTSIGRLRPHFIDVCQPDWSKINCSSGYILNYECTSTEHSPSTRKDSHLSFPSGHASFGTYCALYAVYYLQFRFRIGRTEFLKPSLQLILMVLAFYCCVTRVMDFKHHATDVVSGAFIGALVASVIFFKLTLPIMKNKVRGTGLVNQNNNRRPQFHHLDSVMTTVSSCPSDMGSYQAVSEESSDPNSLPTCISVPTPTPLIVKNNIA